ncbi:MAG: ATP-grasp domain-containing protein [Methylovirgula sp.]
MKALVFGHNFALMAPIPTLLSRAGFTVDLISDERMMTRCRNVNNFCRARNPESVVKIANQNAAHGYDLIVPSDDRTLAEILRAPLSDDEKARLLPVVAREDWVHIYSKIGLSKVLAAHGVNSPAFRVARDRTELERTAHEFNRPFVIKNDSSGGGQGVFLCETPEDVDHHAEKIVYPVLVQEWIDGQLLDLSGFFQKGKPIFFSYAEILESRPNAFAGSVLRRYFCLDDLDADCFEGIEKLGKALGANGFVNISCLRAKRDGNLYFFEADMRPNVWVEYPKFIGEDPAPRIADYFLKGITLSRANNRVDQSTGAGERSMVLSYIGRMEREEIAANKYECQKYRLDYFDPPHWALRRFWLKPLAELLLTIGREARVEALSAAGLELWHLMPPPGADRGLVR